MCRHPVSSEDAGNSQTEGDAIASQVRNPQISEHEAQAHQADKHQN